MWITKDEAEHSAIDEIINLPPRAVAIVGAAFVHNRLSYAVSECFPVEGRTKAGLFGENGRLADFDIQSKMAYTLGIISSVALGDFERLARVRNKFAHRLDVVNFDHPEVAPICSEFKLVERHLFPFGMPYESTPKGIPQKFFVKDLSQSLGDNRKRFQLTVMIVTTALSPWNAVGGKNPQVMKNQI